MEKLIIKHEPTEEEFDRAIEILVKKAIEIALNKEKKIEINYIDSKAV